MWGGWAERLIWLFEHVCTARHCLAPFDPFAAIPGSVDIYWIRSTRLCKQKQYPAISVDLNAISRDLHFVEPGVG